MMLWLLTRKVYSENPGVIHRIIVAAETPDEARQVHPHLGVREVFSGHDDGSLREATNRECWKHEAGTPHDWADSPEEVTAMCIGVANSNVKPGVVLASSAEDAIMAELALLRWMLSEVTESRDRCDEEIRRLSGDEG